MRILFLTDNLLDLVSDPLYIGLVRTVGIHNVYDYPSKAIFHIPYAKRWCLPQVPGRGRSEEEVHDLLSSQFFDIACVATPRKECVALLERLYEKNRFPPIIFIDGADDCRIRHEVIDRFPVSVYFKREYVWHGESKAARLLDCARAFRFDRGLYTRTFPLQISVVLDEIGGNGQAYDKTVDVSFHGYVSHRNRLLAVEMLKTLKGEGFKTSTGIYASATDRKYKIHASPMKRFVAKFVDRSYVTKKEVELKLSPTEYYSVLRKSRMAVSIRGGGFDTLRYWEIVACKAMLLSEQPNIVIPHNFEDRNHAVFCRPGLQDLKELIRYYIKYDDERTAIAQNGYEHLEKYHTCERRAEYFLGVCARTL